MARITIVTRLRFVGAIAPVILLLVTPILAVGFYGFGQLLSIFHDTQYSGMRAGQGMQIALYQMDWGRGQPEGLQIVKDQQRSFVGWLETARSRAETPDQLERLQKIAQTANPIFDAMRKASPGDDSFEPRLRELQGQVAELLGADETVMMALGEHAESQARKLMVLALAAGIVVPWACFILLLRLSGRTNAALRDIRQAMEAFGQPESEPDRNALKTIDENLTALGYPKPNPMLAE